MCVCVCASYRLSLFDTLQLDGSATYRYVYITYMYICIYVFTVMLLLWSVAHFPCLSLYTCVSMYWCICSESWLLIFLSFRFNSCHFAAESAFFAHTAFQNVYILYTYVYKYMCVCVFMQFVYAPSARSG